MRPEFEWARRTRRAVSLLVIGIAALSLAVQALARRLAPEEATPSPDQRSAIAAGGSPSVGAATPGRPDPTPAASVTSTRGSPSPAAAAAPGAAAVPPTPPATAVAALPTAPSAPPPPPAPPPAAAPPATAAPGTVAVVPRAARVISDQAARSALLRAAPSVRALVVGQAPAGATVEVLGEARGDAVGPAGDRWLRVRYGGVIGYVYAPLVE